MTRRDDYIFTSRISTRGSREKQERSSFFLLSTIKWNVKRCHLHFEARNFASGCTVHSSERETPRCPKFRSRDAIFLLNAALKLKVSGIAMKTSWTQTRLLARIGYPTKTPNEMFVIVELLANRGYAVEEIRLEFTRRGGNFLFYAYSPSMRTTSLELVIGFWGIMQPTVSREPALCNIIPNEQRKLLLSLSLSLFAKKKNHYAFTKIKKIKSDD